MKIRNTAMLSIIAISVVTLSGYLFVPRAAGTRGLGIKGFGVRCGIYADLLWMCLGYLINTFFFKLLDMTVLYLFRRVPVRCCIVS